MFSVLQDQNNLSQLNYFMILLNVKGRYHIV